MTLPEDGLERRLLTDMAGSVLASRTVSATFHVPLGLI